MAKSLRSKAKRTFRRVKRETGVFAAADAARLHRLSAKLQAKIRTTDDSNLPLTELMDDAAEGKETEEGATAVKAEEAPATAVAEGSMDIDSSLPHKISTSGRRLSRRDAWRLSKGKALYVKNPAKMNRLGGVAAKRKAGRSKRRR